MCGIVGIVPRVDTPPEKLGSLVRCMAGALIHRGPDDEGFFVTSRVALGVRRLSIIDVANGHQPISTAGGSKVIAFNGEIYNYRTLRRELERAGRPFKTQADTEVALQAFDRWGAEGIGRLEGMFALAVWEEEKARLTLARDWFGQKSIYYAETDLGWIFGSEIKALLALDQLPPDVDLETLSHYMTLRYLPGKGTLFKGVHKVPPAHAMEVTASARTSRRLWQPAYEPKWRRREADVLDELDSRMQAVVGEHLMSEVPLGAFLSGGIDSSLVVAYAARASETPVRTFSIGVDDASQSELPWAREVAARYATHHTEKIIEPDLVTLAPAMVHAMEEPVDPFAAGVYVVSEITAREVTVALGGDGGDELFAGYDRYIGQQLAETYGRLPAALRRKLLRPLFRIVPETFGYNSIATKLRWLDRMAELDGVARYAESAAFLRFPHSMKADLFAPDIWKTLERRESEQLLAEFFADGSASAFLDKMLYTDCATRLAEHQLPIVDRMSMAHSLEVRSPFLDRRVAEFAMKIPAGWKVKGRRIKYLTRKMGKRYLSRHLLYRKKQGFGFPLGRWFRGELRGMVERLVAQSRMVEVGIFNRAEMLRLVAEHVDGRMDHNYRLWMLFNLEIWYRHFIDLEDVSALTDWGMRLRAGG
ncbi:MAG: asparagine synthase (glutamine-hydrolyzing) [Acidobacteriota bacterium]